MTPEALEEWATKRFLNAFSNRREKMIRNKVTKIASSQRAFEEHWEMSGLGTFALIPEGGPVPYDVPVQGNRRRLFHMKYGLAYRVTEEMREDDRWDVVTAMADDLIDSGMDHQERIAHGPWNDATAGSSFVTLDGVAFVSTAHTSLKGGGTRSNRLSPDADLAPESIEALLTQARLTVDEQGRFLNFRPTTLLTHPNQEWEAQRILESSLRPGTADNDTNVLNRLGIKTIFSPYLTDTDAFFMFDEAALNVLWFDRRKMTTKTGSDFDSDDVKTKVTYRASVAVPKWEGCYGTSGA
jgi:hypothetical protein